MVFVDTGAWFVLHVPTDPNHQRAVDWLQENDEPLVTTDFVIDENLAACPQGTPPSVGGRTFVD